MDEKDRRRLRRIEVLAWVMAITLGLIMLAGLTNQGESELAVRTQEAATRRTLAETAEAARSAVHRDVREARAELEELKSIQRQREAARASR